MRILSGTLARQEIHIPTSLPIRPTSAKVRGQIFNICRDLIANEYVIDICAGSGAIGIEALSQGARHAFFIEKDPIVVAHLKKNIYRLHLDSLSTIIHNDSCVIIPHLMLEPVSLIYIDPPYLIAPETAQRLLNLAAALPHTPYARLFFERSKKAAPLLCPEQLTLLKERCSADTSLFEYGFA